MGVYPAGESLQITVTVYYPLDTEKAVPTFGTAKIEAPKTNYIYVPVEKRKGGARRSG